jgi:hypothetical protein
MADSKAQVVSALPGRDGYIILVRSDGTIEHALVPTSPYELAVQAEAAERAERDVAAKEAIEAAEQAEREAIAAARQARYDAVRAARG